MQHEHLNAEESTESQADSINLEDIYQRDQIRDMGSSTSVSERGAIHCLTIVGQVEGHQLLPENIKSTKYEHVMPMLAAIEESDEIEGLLILIKHRRRRY